MINSIKKTFAELFFRHPLLIIVMSGMILIGFFFNASLDKNDITGTAKIAYLSLYGVVMIAAGLFTSLAFESKDDK